MPLACSSRTIVTPRRRLPLSRKSTLTAMPIATPSSRSVSTIAASVMTKGMNCPTPSRHIERNTAGLASLKPVITRIAASAASGMRLSRVGSANTHSASSTPWKMADTRVRPPALAFTELRMITEVIGMPPTMPAVRLPMPCATSSRFGGE